MSQPHPYYNRDSYAEFVASEGIPIVEAFAVDCRTVDVAPWPRMGGKGAYVHLAGRGDFVSAYIMEIPPGGQLERQRHLHEEVVCVLAGRGSTVIHLPDGSTHSFEWGPHSLFALPLNATHQHFNGSGAEPARLFAVTDLPIMMNIFHNPHFLFNTPYDFADRLGEARYYRGEGEFREVKPGRHQWETCFVPDLTAFQLPDWHARGGETKTIQFTLAESIMHAHVSQFAPGVYKKAHWHGAGAHVLCLTGHGYSLVWPKDEPVDPERWIRTDWAPGSVFCPPEHYFHQHFNTAPGPARYLALNFAGVRYPIFAWRRAYYDNTTKSADEGGHQIEYEDEHPAIRALFEAEVRRHGGTSRMDALVART